jgi:hypothetical protein
MRLRDIQKKMQEELEKAEKERQENERKFREIKKQNLEEKAMLQSIIEAGNENIESMKEEYKEQIKNLENQMAASRRELIEARSQGRGEIFIFCLRIFYFNLIFYRWEHLSYPLINLVDGQ